MTGYDTIVVGAGSAGCVLAARLSEDPSHRVLLLEAGPDHAAHDLPEELRTLSLPVAWPYDWGNQVETTGGRLLHYGRGRGIGGSSSTNGAVAMRPEPEDFASWPSGWGWDDMLPYLNAIENDLDFGDRPWHGTDGPIPITRWPAESWNAMQAGFVEGCIAMGFPFCADHNEPGSSGVGPVPMNRVGLARVSAATAYLDPARNRPNLTVRGDAHVQRVLFEGGRASGIELDGGEVVRADHVVLSAGVVQDPLLLWRSGIGPANALRALAIQPVVDLPSVGRNVTDHYVVTFSAEIRPDTIPDDAPSLQTILRATAPNSERTHDLQLTPFARRHRDGRRELAISVSLQLPDGEGSITPTGPHATDAARIAWPFAGIASNTARVRDGWRLAASVIRASGLLRRPDGVDAALAASDAEVDDLVAETHSAFYHGVGTCRFGDVVDERCRVLGVERLSVVDAAVIPTVPRSNTNLAVMALAERYCRLT